MNPGIGVSLVFILTLVLAVISTVQTFNPFARQPEAAPEPAGLIDLVAGEARQPADFASIGEQPFFIAGDAGDDAAGLLAHGDQLYVPVISGR